ncbi:DUF1876 domain-containing protein [Dactylosporangium matsuzakiense]|uniref:DUF1876 domain-containing protein n=1 Tax=Dactylosporangium matsuzakiense TaxID=53360 RepID=A0A9W6KSM9_9ACTN|nr:DUF1876 domain-containing protein [Dactylosporangium matsuzakiense]UWZ41396.1 DUF1876 domain-containing protein [Dactylosporangium matsuzakiense]GLL06498.1 hypothetical protein GCM10017581_082480 [Dactylosporangium matsuzakiense]
MPVSKRWTVEVLIGEDHGNTSAVARLDTNDGTHLVGAGQARLNPADDDIPAIGDELAAARALSDLGHRLLLTAAADVAAVAEQPVHLTW